jgi:hypothetical protein
VSPRLAWLTLLLGLGGAHAWLLRRPILAWGADRRRGGLYAAGGHALLAAADGVAEGERHRAPPSAVWPWLVQIGPAPDRQ